jgi:hypothetical protein
MRNFAIDWQAEDGGAGELFGHERGKIVVWDRRAEPELWGPKVAPVDDGRPARVERCAFETDLTRESIWDTGVDVWCLSSLPWIRLRTRNKVAHAINGTPCTACHR